MPHNYLVAIQLEQQYPSLEAVEDLDIPDLSRLEDEQLYAAGMDVVQEILREMSQIGKQGGEIRSGDIENEPTDASLVTGSRNRIRGGGHERDRSGFGQGGDRSGRVAAASGLQVCALHESTCSYRHETHAGSAQTYCNELQPPQCGSVRVDQDRAGSRSVKSAVRPDMEDMASPVEAIESVEGRPVRPRAVNTASPEEGRRIG